MIRYLSALAARKLPLGSRASPDLESIRSVYEDPTTSDAERRKLCYEQALSRNPRGEFARELGVLGLQGQSHTAEIYASALSSYLGKEICIVRIPAFDSDLGELGRTLYLKRESRIKIEVSLRVSWWLYQYTLLHELGHIAAGHPPAIFDKETGDLSGFGEPPAKWLASQPPLTEVLPPAALLDLYEAEAELRAEHALLMGAGGRTILQTDSLVQLH